MRGLTFPIGKSISLQYGRPKSLVVGWSYQKVGGTYRKRSGRKFDRKAVLHILKNPFYLGKFRWQKQVYDGNHEPIIAESTFHKAAEILKKRAAENPGTRLHNQDEHLLSGVIKCGRCNSNMVGVSGRKNGVKYSYYACSKRLDTKECDQDYVRSDKLEAQILTEVQSIFRNEALLAEIWSEAQKKLTAEAPDVESEIAHIQAQPQKTQATLSRYFTAFESGTMDPATCNQRVEELTTQARQLENERDTLKAKRSTLDLPALKKDFLDQILNNLTKVVGAVPPGQKKHLLHLLVKKVLIHDRRTAEIWYRLPQESPVRTLSDLVASMGQYANRVGGGGREVVFSASSAYRVVQQRDILIEPQDVLVTIH